jgi:hypothetical protein
MGNFVVARPQMSILGANVADPKLCKPWRLGALALHQESCSCSGIELPSQLDMKPVY